MPAQETDRTFDLAVVGGGIVGLAHAYEGARAGLKVALFERSPAAAGATIRNFGMVWPIGQPEAGFDRAMRSREVWLKLASEARFWAQPWGSLHLAYHDDEMAVLEEFIHTSAGSGAYQATLLNPAAALDKSPAVRPVGLKGAMYSATEVNVDPREATEAIHRYLREAMGVAIYYGVAITHIAAPVLAGSGQEWKAERIVVCTGADFETLYPAQFEQEGLVKCKLQMMRTGVQPNNWQLGPNLAAGLTLQHYGAFANCKSLAAVKKRFARRMAEYNQWGIHVMVSQTAKGELTIGDSHEYSLNPSPFDKQFINDLILDYLRGFAQFPNAAIAETWHGVYPKCPRGRNHIRFEPEPGVMVVNGLGGAGMTLSFGLAQETMA
jgi:FAD dependent oxidoreductase TIGR03364